MNITIVGGGFAGVKTALELLKDPRNSVTIITDKPDFQYYPALYNTATGHAHEQSWTPLSEIFAGKENIEVIIDTITAIDPHTKQLTTALGTVIEYEYAILALGAVTTYFGIEGLDKYAYGIKSYQEIQALKAHLHDEVRHDHALDNHYVIIGAGPTGVELAASLKPYLERLSRKYKLRRQKYQIDVIEAMPRVLPRMPEKVSALVLKRLRGLGVNVMLDKKVESQDATHLKVSGEFIESHTVIWTSGVANHPFFQANESHFRFAPNHKVIVDDYLQVNKHLWVIGDNAATQWSGLAQNALRDAKFVARNIRRKQDGKSLKKYSTWTPQVVVPVGDNWAVYTWKKIVLTGWMGHLPRRAADFIGYTDVLPFAHAMRLWSSEKKLEDDYFPAEPSTATTQSAIIDAE